jgi:hypothetical protein
MTKLRAPLTFENALAKVAGHIGWEETAKICGQAERTVRNWSEPDTTASITLEAAFKLDIAFHAAGGDGCPFLYCYMTRVDMERLAACPGREALLTSIAESARESGEALAAAIAAAHPAAGRADFAIGERELEESIDALQNSLAALRARRKAALAGELGEDQEGTERTVGAPGVAQPVTA